MPDSVASLSRLHAVPLLCDVLVDRRLLQRYAILLFSWDVIAQDTLDFQKSTSRWKQWAIPPTLRLCLSPSPALRSMSSGAYAMLDKDGRYYVPAKLKLSTFRLANSSDPFSCIVEGNGTR